MPPGLANPATGTSQYRGVATYSSECFNADGSVRVVKGYNTTETTVINVTAKNAQGVTTAFTGTLTIRFAPTAAGKAAGCGADFIGDSFKSVKRTA